MFDNVFADSCNYENWDNRDEDGNMFIIKPITLINILRLIHETTPMTFFFPFYLDEPDYVNEII